MSIRRLIIRLSIPFSWRFSRDRSARSLMRFSMVEADSAWQMLQALARVDDPEFEVELFNNALEEVHHADLFYRLAKQQTDRPIMTLPFERQLLYDPARGLAEFEAFHYVGEADIYNNFESYARASSAPDVRATFTEIRGDELEHQQLALRKLIQMTGSPRNAKKLIRRVRRRRLYETWRRAGNGVGVLVSTLLYSAIYFVVGPIYFVLCRRRMSSRSRVDLKKQKVPVSSVKDQPDVAEVLQQVSTQ